MKGWGLSLKFFFAAPLFLVLCVRDQDRLQGQHRTNKYNIVKTAQPQ